MLRWDGTRRCGGHRVGTRKGASENAELKGEAYAMVLGFADRLECK
jgi:hypothetical protein